MKYSNVIDTPRPPGSEDLLGVDRYVDALSQFIEVAQMPTTLAIQGEWGSGKTSLMNQVRHRLCDMSESEAVQKPFFGVWINTWQYAMMRSPEETLINVIQALRRKFLRSCSATRATCPEPSPGLAVCLAKWSRLAPRLQFPLLALTPPLWMS